MDQNDEDLFKVPNVPERRNNDDFINGENPARRDQGARGGRGRSRNTRSSATSNNDLNSNWRTSKRPDSTASTKPNDVWKSVGIRSKSINEKVSWRQNDDENHSSDAESTGSRSSAFSVPSSCSRSSSSKRGRSTSSFDDKKPTNWRDRNVKIDEKPAQFQFYHGNKSTRTDRSQERSSKTEFTHSNSSRPHLRDKSNDLGFDCFNSTNRRGGRNESNRSKVPDQERFVGYKYLKELSEKEPHQIICEILKPNANIDVILNRKEIKPNWIILIVEIIRKLCECDFKVNRAQVLQHFCESTLLLDHISHYLSELAMEKNEKNIENLNSFVSDLVVFYFAVIKTIPTVAVEKNFDRFLTKTKIGIDQMKTYLQKDIDEEVVKKLENLEKVLQDETNIRDKKVERPRRNYLDLVGNLSPPDDFRDLSLYPTEEDLNRPHFGFVRPNKIRGSYENVDHYLDVQFRLIREDFIDPLRRGINDYKEAISVHGKAKYKYDSVRFYPDTKIQGIEITKDNQVAYSVNFDENGRLKINWETSKRFMFGSLLLFTRDNFQTFFFATVLNRDLKILKNGCILVALVGNKPLDRELMFRPLVMAECEVYFEPYCLVMKALKSYTESAFPMKKFIVYGDTTLELPKYIIGKGRIEIHGYSVNVSGNYGWPDPSDLGFDVAQFEAFKTAFSSNFTVIQGPPGTGKTYLGLKIVKALLDNTNTGLWNCYTDEEWDSDTDTPEWDRYRGIGLDRFRYLDRGWNWNNNLFRTPILLVCYTNHALDQFLEGILKFTDKIIRVGGQSKCAALEEFNLRGRVNLSRHRKKGSEFVPAMKFCRYQIQEIFSEIRTKTEEKKKVDAPHGILSYHILSRVIEPEFSKFIQDDETLLLWLLDTDTYNDPYILQNNFTENVEQNLDADPNDSAEINEESFVEDEDETIQEHVLINEDDIFLAEKCHPEDFSHTYCLSKNDLKFAFFETQRRLKYLEKHEFEFDNFTEYHMEKYELKEDLRIIHLQATILYHYLEKPELNSFARDETRHLNLWDLPLELRWTIYWSWVSKLKPIYAQELRILEAEHRIKTNQYEEFKQLEDFHVVQNALVVGMTTTSAARLQLFLKLLKPAIVIVEEAAEVLESHVVVSLSTKCEHVILIGDHKQLRPSTAVYELSKKYNIDVSLFERMINNNMYCPQLQMQHRMRPEISSLIVPSIYPNLKNHESVFEYPSVKGITKNVFFVEHNVYEEDVEDSSSRQNEFEADFVIQLCRYVLLQGYEAEKITILTTYTGQMYLLRKSKHEYAIMKDVKVVVVDKYQGEENDIILLSLVRSNDERRIGFLSIENRVCVAFSRAKIGLYMIGNMDILSDCSLWRNIKEELIKQEAIGRKLPLYCDTHDVRTEVSCKSDFSNVLEGGCNNYCHQMMDCGHRCQRFCHKIDLEHLDKQCREPCLKQCVENHPCQKSCYLECGDCTAPTERILPCEHKVVLPCFEDYLKHQCVVEESITLELCSHEVKKKCFESIDSVKCTFPCEDRLDCGHQCVKSCHKTEDPDHVEYQCEKLCEKIILGCSKQHKCQKPCFEDCGKCKERVEFTLKCGHVTILQCSVDIENFKCDRPCEKRCLDCDAVCPKKCSENCKPCMNLVTKTIPDCGHERILECSTVPKRSLCLEKCERNAPCGHKCKSVCGEICGTERCMEMVKSNKVRALCGHGNANVPCWRRNEAIDAEELLQNCTEPCNEVLKCGDLCSGTCGSCWQKRLHQRCQEKCGNVLVCGHRCIYPCRNLCPPCNKKCQYACRHSKCPRDCGLPCMSCRQRCTWKCSHFKCRKKCGDMCDRPPCYAPCPKKLKCKHDCIGFCGEPCPPKCRICDADEVETIVSGEGDKDDARFVLLVDCKHIIESKAMDKHINTPAEKGEIVMKVCPLCKTPISKTLRYMNQVKQFYQDIQNLKDKMHGNERETKQIRDDLIKKLKNLDLRKDQLTKKVTDSDSRFVRTTGQPDQSDADVAELRLIPETVQTYRRRLENRGRKSNISKQALRAMHFFVDMFSSIISRLDDIKTFSVKEKSRLYKKLELLLKHVNPETLLINVQQVEETQRELNRYHRIVDYVMYSNKPEFLSNRESPDVVSIHAEIVDILYGLKSFDNEQNARIGELFGRLHEEIKASEPVSQKDKQIIHEAMAKDFYGGVNSQGHWFTCTRAHYFRITKCGETMEESKCPECDEKIMASVQVITETWKLQLL